MVSLAVSKPPADMPASPNLPELSDAVYFDEVLRLPVEKSEDHIEDELIARARQLGLSPPPPPHNVPGKRYTSSAESASTVPTFHARTFSTASNDSASTILTVDSSVFAPSSPQVAPTAANDKQRRPRPVTLSQYDKYLSQIDKNLDQPKFRKASVATTDPSSKSIFSVSTKRSLASMKSNIRSRIRWRAKSDQPYAPNLFV